MDTPTTTPSQTPSPTPDVFDAIASTPTPSPASSPTSTATSTPQQGQSQGDVFDTLDNGTSNTNPVAGQTAPIPDSLHIDPTDNVALQAAKRVNAVGAGIGEGVLNTLNGGAELLHLPHSTLQQRQDQLTQQNAENPTLNKVGYGTEALSEFLLGDEALKGLSLGDKFLKVSKVAHVLDDSPRLMKAVQIGMQALRGATVQGALTTANTDSVKDGAVGAAGGLVAGGALGALGEIPSLYRGLTAGPKIQAAFQGAVRDTLDKVASDAGVSASPSASIRDVAGQVGDAVIARSKSAYQTLDAATGGRFQRFEDALKNVNQRLRETAGLDDDAEDALLKRKAEIEQSQKETFDEAKAKGVDPNLVENARADWKQAQSLYDLDRQIKMSSSGMRPELAKAGSATTPEALDPTKAFTRLNRLYDSGRLQQAVGQDQAQLLLQHADSAFTQNAKTVALQKGAKTAAKIAVPGAVGIGLGAKELFDLTK